MGYCDRLRRKVEKLEAELQRKDKLLERVADVLDHSPHGFVKQLRQEVIDELSTTEQGRD